MAILRLLQIHVLRRSEMSGAENTELTERQRFWLRHLRACEVSGQTSINYARTHGIKVKSLYSAARKALVGCVD